MLILVHGNSWSGIKKKRKEILNTLKKQRPDAEVFSFDAESSDDFSLQGMLGGQGLFEQKYVVLLSSILEDKELGDSVLRKLQELKESQNVFVLTELYPKKTLLTKLKKYAHTEYEVNEKENIKKPHNSFIFAEAFASRDKRKIWLEYNKARQSGSSIEELNGILFWQIKSLLLAKNSISAKEAGLKPFVFSKSKKYSGNFTQTELNNASSELIEMYHEARRGKGDLAASFEQFLLSF